MHNPDASVQEVARLMVDNKIGGLPVVDECNRIVGVTTETDFLKTFVEMFAGRYPGLHLTLEIPGRKDVLLKLAKAISDLGSSVAAGVLHRVNRPLLIIRSDDYEK